jgi:hypothetical protein
MRSGKLAAGLSVESTMNAKKCLRALLLPAALAAVAPALGMDATSLARLKKAGVTDATIGLMVKERTVETAAFTVEDILAMKAVGIGETALQTLIREGSFMQGREPVVYGRDLHSLRLATVEDILRLKQAGVSDEVLQAIVNVSRRGADVESEQALLRLQEMGVWLELPK